MIMCAGCGQKTGGKWCCSACWEKLPAHVQGAMKRSAQFKDDGATRCREVLKRQAEDFWRGSQPMGYLWNTGAEQETR